MTGLDQAAGRVIDPVVSMTREMARITADTAMKPAEKDEELAEIKSTLEAFPASFPPAHIELINRNVKTIVALLFSGVK